MYRLVATLLCTESPNDPFAGEYTVIGLRQVTVFGIRISPVVSVNGTIQVKTGLVCKSYLVVIETRAINHVEHDISEILPLSFGMNWYGVPALNLVR